MHSAARFGPWCVVGRSLLESWMCFGRFSVELAGQPLSRTFSALSACSRTSRKPR